MTTVKRSSRKAVVNPDRSDRPIRPLTKMQQRFVAEYLIDFNATRAAIRAGYSPRSAGRIGHTLVNKSVVSAEIDKANVKRNAELEQDAHAIVRNAWLVLTADPRELVEHWVLCCRYCYGLDFKKQRTLAEYGHDQAQHRLKGIGNFDAQGGIGFDSEKEPNPDCPECFGKGVGRTIFHDTRHLSPAAAALYAGTRKTKYGQEVLMHDKMAALDLLMKRLGLYPSRRKRGRGQGAQTVAAAARSLIKGIYSTKSGSEVS